MHADAGCIDSPPRAASLVRDAHGRYWARRLLTEDDLLQAASSILLERCKRLGVLSGPETTAQYLQARLGTLDAERFEAVWVDAQHRIIAVETLACGTIDAAAVYPREVIKSALRHGAGAVVLCHNHPSGVAEPSAADRALTTKLKEALKLIEVRVLDHLVVAATEWVSFAARGWL
jgi:DNA repair protein RadC